MLKIEDTIGRLKTGTLFVLINFPCFLEISGKSNRKKWYWVAMACLKLWKRFAASAIELTRKIHAKTA